MTDSVPKVLWSTTDCTEEKTVTLDTVQEAHILDKRGTYGPSILQSLKPGVQDADFITDNSGSAQRVRYYKKGGIIGEEKLRNFYLVIIAEDEIDDTRNIITAHPVHPDNLPQDRKVLWVKPFQK